MQVSKGDRVEWDWIKGSAQGRVAATYEQKITRRIKGSAITRKGSAEDPALYIEMDDGRAVLKLASEVRHA